MSHQSKSPGTNKWDYLKNERYDAKVVSVYEIVHRKQETTALHDHPSLTHRGFRFEIAYITAGEAVAFTETSRFPVKAGDYVMIDSSVRHGFELKSDVPLHMINANFERNAIGHITPHSKTFAEIAKYHQIINNQTSSKPIEDLILHDDNGDVLEKLKSLKEEYDRKLPGYQGVVKARLTDIVLTSLRKYFYKEEQKEYSAAVNKIIDYMESAYMSNITLTDFSKKLGISLKNLCVLFKKEVGMTYTEYVHRRRIIESCDLILNTNESIEFISDLVGYSDIKKFRKKFKDFAGITPREYRRLYKNRNE